MIGSLFRSSSSSSSAAAAASSLSQSTSTSSTSLRQRIVRKIRHWWTQSNTSALYHAQDTLLSSLIQTPYTYTSQYGMNSVEFIKPQVQEEAIHQQQPEWCCHTKSSVMTSGSSSSNSSNRFSIRNNHDRLLLLQHNNNNYINYNGNRSMNCTTAASLFGDTSWQRRYHRQLHPQQEQQRHDSFAATADTTVSSLSNQQQQQQQTTTTTTVVIAHGFGSGLGFFYRNVDVLLSYPNIHRVVLVDWIGMGGSDRPLKPKLVHQQQKDSHYNSSNDKESSFRMLLSSTIDNNNNNNNNNYKTQQAIDFFLEPFHQWFQSSIVMPSSCRSNKEHIVLVGHSLGGYLCSQYAVRYPQHISKLVLASPVGFSTKQQSTTVYNNNDNSTNYHIYYRNHTVQQQQHHHHQQHLFYENLYSTGTIISNTDMTTESSSNGEKSILPSRSRSTRTFKTKVEEKEDISLSSSMSSSTTESTVTTAGSSSTIATVLPNSRKVILQIIKTLWQSNVTPQQFIRLCGPKHGRANILRKLKQKLVQQQSQSQSTTTQNGSSSSSGTGSTFSFCSSSTSTSPTPNEHQAPVQHIQSHTTTTEVSSKKHTNDKGDDERDLQLLADYLYHITVADPSGEFAMNALLEPTLATQKTIVTDNTTTPTAATTEVVDRTVPTNTSNAITTNSTAKRLVQPQSSKTTTTTSYNNAMGVLAREPLQDVFSQLRLDTTTRASRNCTDSDRTGVGGLQCVKVLYGSHDWMRPNEMIARQSLLDLQERTGIVTSVNVLPNVGHHLYIENPIDFCQQIVH